MQTSLSVNLRHMNDEEQQALIARLLDETGGSRRETARRLGIDPSTLWRKMRRFNY
jgi:transcriptional regulator of acetoin/glycerol metabolism